MQWHRLFPDDPHGCYPHRTLSDARAEARRLWATRSDGVDPRAERRRPIKAQHEADQASRLAAERRITVRMPFERWQTTALHPRTLADGRRMGRRDGGASARAAFERRLFAKLGDVAAADVTRGDLLVVLDGAKSEGKLRTANILMSDSLSSLASGRSAMDLAGADAMRIAAGWLDGQGAARTLGFAAVNALSRHLFDRMGFVPPEAPDSIGGLDRQPGDHIGMAGLFPPLVRQVTALGARLTVLELRDELAGEHAGFTVTLDPKDLNGCNKLLSTSTVLLNHTFDVVLANSRQAHVVSLVGPGAGCLPDALFEAGVTALGGTWIIDPSGFKQALHDGQPWRRLARKFALTAADWPHESLR